MCYFNGSQHGWNDANGYHHDPITEIYCDACAHAGTVPFDRAKPYGQQHWETGFSWAPWGGGPCHKCGRETHIGDREYRQSAEHAAGQAARRAADDEWFAARERRA